MFAVYVNPMDPVDQVDPHQPNEHRGPVLAERDAFRVIDCQSCGFKHLDPLPTGEELRRIYRQQFYEKDKPLYLERHRADLPWWRLVYRERYESLEAHLPAERRRVLDVGAGPGFFLEAGLERGWDATGLEPSPRAAEHARSLGAEIVEGFLDQDTARALGRFDAVHLGNVLEHLPDPRGTLGLIREQLDPGGLILVVVPNDFNPIQRAAHQVCDLPDWWVAPPHHLNYFDHGSLARLLARAGFEVLETTSSFPIDLFLLMGDRYVGDDELGRDCHGRRMELELNLDRAGLTPLRRRLYRALADLGLGREAIALGRRREDSNGLKSTGP